MHTLIRDDNIIIVISNNNAVSTIKNHSLLTRITIIHIFIRLWALTVLCQVIIDWEAEFSYLFPTGRQNAGGKSINSELYEYVKTETLLRREKTG